MDARTQVNDFNWEIDLFLRVLSRFRENVNKADSNTLKLLSDTLMSIDEFISGADGIDDNHENSKLFFIDDSKFEIGRFITCRICFLQIPLTHCEYLNHATSDYHNARLIRHHETSTNRNPFSNANAISSSTTNDTKLIERIPNGKAHDSNGHRAANPLDKINNYKNAIAKSNAAKNGTSWRDRAPAQTERKFVRLPNNKVASKPLSQAPKPIEVAKPTYAVRPAEVEKVRAPTVTQQVGTQPPPKPMPTALQSVELAPSVAAPKISPMIPPNVFDEDIFDFIASQDKIKRNEPIQSLNKTVETPNKIMNASISAEIKPSKPYELNSMYTKFNHLKPTASASASVPIAAKPATAKPKQNPFETNSQNNINSSHVKAPTAYDLQLYEFLSKVANTKTKGTSGSAAAGHKPNQLQPAKPSYEAKSTTTAKLLPDAGLSGKLKQMFDEINKLKSKAELEEIQSSKNLERASSIVSLPAAAAANETNNQMIAAGTYRRSQNAPSHGETNVRGRSLSNTNIVRATPVDTSKGAIPKQRFLPNANNTNNKDTCSPGIQLDALTAFFSRDLTPFLSHLMKNAIGLSALPTNKTITDEIEQLLLPKYPNVKCYLIGSRIYGIAKESSSLDIYLNLLDSFHKDKSANVFSDAIWDAEKKFKQNSNWSDVKCTEPTRYGILCVTHNASKIKCRMIFGTGVPIRNTELIQCFFDVQPVCRQLAICVELAIMEASNQSLQRFKNGYIITLLVLFYFQNQKKLPSVKSLQVAASPKIKCGENAVEFQKPTNISICSERFLNILLSFFKFYAEFNFSENIISVFHGHEIKHSIRNTPDDKLEPSLLRFKRFMFVELSKWTTGGMCVQDIFMHKRNVTLKVGSSDTVAFQNFCKDALSALQSVGPSVRY